MRCLIRERCGYGDLAHHQDKRDCLISVCSVPFGKVLSSRLLYYVYIYKSYIRLRKKIKDGSF